MNRKLIFKIIINLKINVLSKADLFNEAELPFDLDFYTKLPDITKLVDVLDVRFDFNLIQLLELL